MTTITLNTESLFKDILAAFDTMNRETPLNKFLVDLGRHQTLVLKEMIEGQLPHLMAEQSKEVKKLEEQNEKMLGSLKICTELLMLISMDPANSPLPLEPISSMRPQILDAISVAVEIITNIEGEEE
jgi:hypothetical protein